ncbi:MAG: GNAT family N-acetyltransferase [Pseudomonadota bacterium]|jgi:GNAT superfamily N-acetyltransferase|nr:GNAT family N-acetyltransferase [Pseudomonadota bacterium]
MPDLPEGYSITRAELDDIPALISVDKAASALFAPTGLLTEEALADHVPAEVLETEIPLSNVFVARNQHDWAIGFALIRPRGTGLYLDQISVHPDHGKKGIGRALVIRTLAEAEARKLPHVSLSTFRDLAWNGPFYASLGFKELSADRLEPYMLEIEEAQKPFMDVSKRCFMRRKVRRSLFRFSKIRVDAD